MTRWAVECAVPRRKDLLFSPIGALRQRTVQLVDPVEPT